MDLIIHHPIFIKWFNLIHPFQSISLLWSQPLDPHFNGSFNLSHWIPFINPHSIQTIGSPLHFLYTISTFHLITLIISTSSLGSHSLNPQVILTIQLLCFWPYQASTIGFPLQTLLPSQPLRENKDPHILSLPTNLLPHGLILTINEWPRLVHVWG